VLDIHLSSNVEEKMMNISVHKVSYLIAYIHRIIFIIIIHGVQIIFCKQCIVFVITDP